MAGCFFSFQIRLFLAWAAFGTWLDNIVTPNQGCSQNRRLKFSPPVKDNYLQGHVFYNISFEAHISCEAECLHRKECVAINIGPAIKGIKVCELCDSDHLQHPNDLKSRRGWTYRGTENICVHKPCFNNGKCFLGYTDKKFLCECQSGYTGERCETDIDECKKGSHDCHINMNCINTAGSYHCSCRPGYTGNGSICKDVDECADNLHFCDASANCTNTIGDYRCVCNPPHYGDQGGKYINISGFSASTILGNDSRYLENLRSFLEPVINTSARSRFVRCWHAKEDGWAASTFHRKCDDKGPTVTIIQVGSFIFGGYIDVSWESPPPGRYRIRYSSKAFIYSLTNNKGSGPHAVYNPVKLRVKPGTYCWYLAAVSSDSYGPRFGWSDIVISNNATSNQDSYTYCGRYYPFPPGYSLYSFKCTFYAGSVRFTPTDIEVFYETTT